MARANLTILLAAIGILAASAAAHAQPLANVTGFDARLLAGKACQGIFDTGRKRAASQGALELRFAGAGNLLTAQAARLVGKEAHDQAAYALTQGQPVNAAGYEQLGAVRDLAVAQGEIRYIDPLGARVVLNYSRGGKLYGHSDPRGGTDARMTRVAVVQLQCH